MDFSGDGEDMRVEGSSLEECELEEGDSGGETALEMGTRGE